MGLIELMKTICWVAVELRRYKSPSHLGNLLHLLKGGPFTVEFGKYFLDLENEAVDVNVEL